MCPVFWRIAAPPNPPCPPNNVVILQPIATRVYIQILGVIVTPCGDGLASIQLPDGTQGGVANFHRCAAEVNSFCA